MKLFKHDFLSQNLDKALCQWALKQSKPNNLKELKAILSYDSRFREQFCEWFKSLREVEPK